MQTSRLQAEQRRAKRQNAKKQNLGIVSGFVSARKRTVFPLLYCTGLRVSNLLDLYVNHINKLLNQGKSVVPLNKGGDSRHTIILSPEGKRLLNEYLP